MEIKLGVGVDEIYFGLDEQSAKDVLGEPDKVYLTESGCRRLQFNSRLLELSFEPALGGRLGWLEVHNPDAVLAGKRIMGNSSELVLALAKKLCTGNPEKDDYGSFVSYFYEDQWLELQFEFDRLSVINLGVTYDANENPEWPAI